MMDSEKEPPVPRTRLVIIAVSLLSATLILSERVSVRSVAAPSNPPKNLYLLESVIRLIRNDYLEEKDPLRTIDGSFKGLVNSLDSCSGYLDAESTSRYLGQRDAPVLEPGILFFKRYGAFPQVIGLVEGSPAGKTDIQLGDLITEIDKKPTPAMSYPEVVTLLNDREAVPLDLKILRDDKTLDLRVERALPEAEPWTYAAQEGMAGVLKIARLTAPCVDGIKAKLLPRLAKSKLPLVIDMRNCGRGSYEEAGRLINLFLKAETVGYFEKRGGAKENLSSPEEPVLPKIPLAIWVNQATLGPAEAAAAVLQDFKRAKIVGLSTLGLAARQQFFPLQDGSSLVLTSGVFSLISGAQLWGRGAEPDVKLEAGRQDFASYLKKTQGIYPLS
jgi:C-terminal peptidase prc